MTDFSSPNGFKSRGHDGAFCVLEPHGRTRKIVATSLTEKTLSPLKQCAHQGYDAKGMSILFEARK